MVAWNLLGCRSSIATSVAGPPAQHRHTMLWLHDTACFNLLGLLHTEQSGNQNWARNSRQG